MGVQHRRAVVQVVHAREALQQNRGKAKVGASGGSGSKVERQVVGASLRCPVVALCGDAGSQLATRCSGFFQFASCASLEECPKSVGKSMGNLSTGT